MIIINPQSSILLIIISLHGHRHRAFQLIQEALHAGPYVLYSPGGQAAFGLLQDSRGRVVARERRHSVLMDIVVYAVGRQRGCGVLCGQKTKPCGSSAWVQCVFGMNKGRVHRNGGLISQMPIGL